MTNNGPSRDKTEVTKWQRSKWKKNIPSNEVCSKKYTHTCNNGAAITSLAFYSKNIFMLRSQSTFFMSKNKNISTYFHITCCLADEVLCVYISSQVKTFRIVQYSIYKPIKSLVESETIEIKNGRLYRGVQFIYYFGSTTDQTKINRLSPECFKGRMTSNFISAIIRRLVFFFHASICLAIVVIAGTTVLHCKKQKQDFFYIYRVSFVFAFRVAESSHR